MKTKKRGELCGRPNNSVNGVIPVGCAPDEILIRKFQNVPNTREEDYIHGSQQHVSKESAAHGNLSAGQMSGQIWIRLGAASAITTNVKTAVEVRMLNNIFDFSIIRRVFWSAQKKVLYGF